MFLEVFMQIGAIQVRSIEDHRFVLDGGAMFGVVPKPLWQKKIPADAANCIPMATRCLLIESEDRRILVDTGMGESWSKKQRNIYGIDGPEGNMLNRLRAFGYEPSDITDIILTHLHFDHAGGLFAAANSDRDSSEHAEADKSLQLRFPQALHHVQRRHFDWSLQASEKDAGSFRPKEVQALADSGQLQLLDGDMEILPGLSVFICDGHTPAQQLVRLKGLSADGATEQLIYCADLIPTAAHIRLPWIMAYDLEPLKSLAEKKQLLRQAFKDDAILVFEHDTEIAACKLIEQGGEIVMGEKIEF